MAKKSKKAPKETAKKPAKKKSPAKKAAATSAADNMNEKPHHGEFMWNELMTRDDEAALAFFERLLGWTHQDWPMGPGAAYRLCKAGSRSVAGIMKMTEPQFPAGVPTHWCGYIAVRDIDATWRQIPDLGGEQIHPTTDIPQVGRFCIFKDPTGAVLGLMQPLGGVL